ncbi:MAG: DegT/DnrJ/EryC1/StrS family aminotransferase [Candidatus Brocadiia bacterium]
MSESTEAKVMDVEKEELALFGGPKAVDIDPEDIFTWPIVTDEDREAVLDVLNRGAMSGTDVTKEFEKDFADWIGSEYALAHPNGTAALKAAMWACGVRAGDEIICPSITYWASAVPALSLGATVNFADIDPETLCIDPDDIEHRIGPKTRAIVVVHYCGYPAEMDPILDIASRHDIRVIEDNSHAHGSLYHGKMCGTMGDIGAMSLMSGKSLPIGEGGMMVTDDRELYERCVAWGHYERTGAPSNYNPPDKQVEDEELSRFAGVAMGGVKNRLNQMASAMGRVQMKNYPERMAEIQKAMNRFWDLLEDVPGMRAHRSPKDSGSTMGGWYHSRGIYHGEELGGLPCERFCEAVRAEGINNCYPGANFPLHTHEVFHSADLFGTGKPTALSFGARDVRQGEGTLPVAERIGELCFGIPWFKHDRPEQIEKYANAYRKVAAQADRLRETEDDE